MLVRIGVSVFHEGVNPALISSKMATTASPVAGKNLYPTHLLFSQIIAHFSRLKRIATINTLSLSLSPPPSQHHFFSANGQPISNAHILRIHSRKTSMHIHTYLSQYKRIYIAINPLYPPFSHLGRVRTVVSRYKPVPP